MKISLNIEFTTFFENFSINSWKFKALDHTRKEELSIRIEVILQNCVILRLV